MLAVAVASVVASLMPLAVDAPGSGRSANAAYILIELTADMVARLALRRLTPAIETGHRGPEKTLSSLNERDNKHDYLAGQADDNGCRHPG